MATSTTLDATKVRFDLKTIVVLLTLAWTPAAMIGGGLLKWGFAMDHRMTVQEATNQNLATVLNKLDATLSGDIKDLRSDVKRLELDVATMKVNK